MAKMFGYARVSTDDQDLSIQEEKLKEAGSALVFSEKASGTTTEARPELARVLAVLGKGDTLVITRVDRLARSLRDLQIIVSTIKATGAFLKATEQPIDTSTAAGKAFFDMLGVFAEFETNIRRERQTEGIAAAKARGVYKGRPRTIDPVQIKSMITPHVNKSQVARDMNISRMSIYRALEQAS